MRGEAYFTRIAPNLRQRRPRLPRIKSGRTPQPVRFPRSGSDLTQESLCLRRIKLMSTRRIAGFARIEPQMTRRRARARCCARHRTRRHSNSRRISSDLTQGITAIRVLVSNEDVENQQVARGIEVRPALSRPFPSVTQLPVSRFGYELIQRF